MGVAIKDLRGKVKRPVRVARVCLDGDLWQQHDRAEEKLNEARQQNPGGKMGEAAAVRKAATDLRAVEDAMRAAEVEIEFRGISTYQLAEIQARFPTKSGQGWDSEAGAHALVAACAVEPTSEDEAKGFLEEAHFAVAQKLTMTAWEATTGSSDIPFSVRASALMNGSGSK